MDREKPFDLSEWLTIAFKEDSTNLKPFNYKPLTEEDIVESEKDIAEQRRVIEHQDS